jgi:hypothetical protein
VTVCIACICDNGKAIVAASDSKLSTGYTSSDRATLKAVRVSKNWAFMYAASDVSPIVPIRLALRERLRASSNKLPSVISLFQSAYQEQVSVRARELGQLPQETLLGIFLMGFGYDEELKPHIFTVEDPQGKIDYHDITGFRTIGTGAQTASSILYFFGQNCRTPLALTLYHASAAKFMAESASDVGKHTSIIVLQPNGEAILLLEPDIDNLRFMWDREGKPRVPAGAPERIAKFYEGTLSANAVINGALKDKGLPPQWSEERD